MITIPPTHNTVQFIKTFAKNISELPSALILRINTCLDFQGTKTLSLLGHHPISDRTNKLFDWPTLLLNEQNPIKLDRLAQESVQRGDWNTVSRIAKAILPTASHPTCKITALSKIVFNLMRLSAEHRQWHIASYIFSTCNRGMFPTVDALYETNLLIQAACNQQRIAIRDIYESTAKIPLQYWKDAALILHLQKIDIRGCPFAKQLEAINLDREVFTLATIHLIAKASRWDLITPLLPRYCNPDDYPLPNLPMVDRLSALKIIIEQSLQESRPEIVHQIKTLTNNPFIQNIITGV